MVLTAATLFLALSLAAALTAQAPGNPTSSAATNRATTRQDAPLTAPLRPELDAVAHLSSTHDLAEVAAHEHLEGVRTLFGFGSNQDFEDSSRVIAFATAGGLGLPDRDYYVKDDAKMREIREKYLAHVGRMFTLLGDDAKTAAAEAQTVMAIETALAKA